MRHPSYIVFVIMDNVTIYIRQVDSYYDAWMYVNTFVYRVTGMIWNMSTQEKEFID